MRSKVVVESEQALREWQADLGEIPDSYAKIVQTKVPGGPPQAEGAGAPAGAGE
jgi:hypothetical protein